jgi:hypothetical protein
MSFGIECRDRLLAQSIFGCLDMPTFLEHDPDQPFVSAAQVPTTPSLREAASVSIADVTSQIDYAGPLKPDDPERERPSRALAAQWIRHLVVCYPTPTLGNPARAITPDTLIPVIYWSTVSTLEEGEENIDLVPLWMLALGEETFLRTYLSTPPDHIDPATTLLGSEDAPYNWHMKIVWGDAVSAEALSEDSRKHLDDAIAPDVLGALSGFNDELLWAIKLGMPGGYRGFDSLTVGMDCGSLEQSLRRVTTDTLATPRRWPRSADVEALGPVSLLPDGTVFRAHVFAGQWLSERGLSSDAQVRVNYHEVETIDSASASKSALVPLTHVVTQGFLSTYQSKDNFYASAASAREGWRYPHISQMTVDFSALQLNGRPLPSDLLQQLQAGVPPGYQGTGQPVITDLDEQGNLPSEQEKDQIRQLKRLDANQGKLARLFSTVPTFDTAVYNLLLVRLKARFTARQFKASLFASLDPENCYVNHFASNADGGRVWVSSQSFTAEMRGSLLSDTPPNYVAGKVGFFTRPDTVDEDHSLFAAPVDTQVLRAMESIFYIAEPTTNDLIRRQLRDDLRGFRNSLTGGELLDPPTASATAEAALAHLLGRRYQHLFNLYRADHTPVTRLTQTARNQRNERERLLDLISTHPSAEDRSRLLRAPVPEVYAVMLEMGSAPARKWPAAMVVKVPDQRQLFLYSLEGGIQRFDSLQALVKNEQPVFQGQKRTIRDISTPLSGHVFEVAADDLLQYQSSALETVLSAAYDQAPALKIFARKVEDALVLPMLSLAEPLAARRRALVEDNRPNFYKAATHAQKARYRILEDRVVQAAYKVGEALPTLWNFTRGKVKTYLQATLHPGVEPDPDKTLVTLSFGKEANPNLTRTTNLTQLMLDNLRPEQYPNAMREVQTVYLIDQDGRRVRNPANGYFITLTGPDLARMATSIDAGGSYEILLRETLDNPYYKASWKAAYQANMKFKGYEAALRGDEVFKEVVHDKAFNPPKLCKRVALWMDAVLQSPTAQARAQVTGAKVHVHGLLLGGSLGAGGQRVSGSVASIDGVLIMSDQAGPTLNGTVGVYFPDSPEGNDFQEFSNLSDGIARLLLREEWQVYFRSRISILNAEELKRILGQRGGRPLVQGRLIEGDCLEEFHRAHVKFQSAHADERSNSNWDVRLNIYIRVTTVVVESMLDFISMFLVPGFQMLKRALRTGLLIYRTGAIPLNTKTLEFVYRVANHGGRRLAGAVAIPTRGQGSFLALTARQGQGGPLAGLPLEEAIYARYAVADSTVLRGLRADAQGFYRATIRNTATGVVTARPIYVRQPDGTVFRVHDHTKMDAVEATIVDPVSGVSIRSSGVMRSNVARVAGGEWRAVGFGRGGGKRPTGTSSPPDSPEPKVPPVSTPAVSNSVRTPGSWDNQIMDLVPAIITRVPSWPQNRSLLIIDSIAENEWSVRFTPQEPESIYPTAYHPAQAGSDIVLTRRAQNHYSLILGDEVVDIPADGDCFFNAVARGLNDGQSEEAYSMQGLRDAAADYIDQHPELSHYLAPQPSSMQQALFDNAPWLDDLLDDSALSALTQIIYGSANPHRLFRPTMDYLDLHINWAGSQLLRHASNADLPAVVLRMIGRLLSRRPPAQLRPHAVQERQALQRFYEDLLLKPYEDREIAALLDAKDLLLTSDVTHMMLEYGVSARDLLNQHPIRNESYVMYDEAVHGRLDEDELDDQLDGAQLVDRSDLDSARQRYEIETGTVLDEDSSLFEKFIYYDRVEDTVDLLRASLDRFPVLLRRADILLASPLINSNLGGLLGVPELAGWIRNPALSDRRLAIISEYASTRYTEMVHKQSIAIDWMRPFDDRNLQRIVAHQDALTDFMYFLSMRGNEDYMVLQRMPGPHRIYDLDMSGVVDLFSAPGQPPSNTRVDVLFEYNATWLYGHRWLYGDGRWRASDARQIWADLVGPHYTDINIRQALGPVGSVRPVGELAAALRASLGAEDARANQIVQDVLGYGQSQAQQYLYNFDFPSVNERLGHTRLDFAIYLESHMKIPDWAWQYLRKGLSRSSLEVLPG